MPKPRVGQTGTPLALKSKVVSTHLTEGERDALNELLGDRGVSRYKYVRALILRDLIQEGYLTEEEVRGPNRLLD